MSAPEIINPPGGGGGGTVTGTGTPGKLAKFATASSVGDSVVTESAGAVTITGSNALRGSRGGGGVANNFAAGDGALTVNTTGAYNTATGANALGANTTGNYNTASGENTLKNNISGGFNTAIGSEALRDNTGVCNTAIGSYALPSNLVGGRNTASGYSALFTNTSGYDNTATGSTALLGNTTGHSNTAVGESALCDNTEGSFNTAIGAYAGAGITTGTGNTVLGAQTGGLAAGLTNNIILANGTGAIKAQHDGTSWAITNAVAVTGALSATSQISSSVSSGYAALFNGGNVGIGTASPGRKLVVNDAAAECFLSIKGVVGGSSGLLIGDPTTEVLGVVRAFTSGPGIYLGAGNNQHLSINSTGNVGIGTASPSALLHVNGNQIGGVGASVTPYPQALFGASSAYTMWWKTGATAGGGLIGAAGPSIYFYVASGTPNAPTLLQVANFDSTGNLILGAATGVSIQAAGSQQGLKLATTPGNIDQNTLDAYREDTVSSGITSSGITNVGTITATRTQIGRANALSIKITSSGGAAMVFSSGWTLTLTSVPQCSEMPLNVISNDSVIGRSPAFVSGAATPTVYGGTAGAFALGINIPLLISGISVL